MKSKTYTLRHDWRLYYSAQVGVSYFPQKDGVPFRHLTVRKLSGRDGIGWDVLQTIKNEVLGPDVLAIEIFPPTTQMIYHENIRHLWEVPEELKDRLPTLAW